MIGILIALKPQGRRFVELNLDGAQPRVSAQFDLEEVALLDPWCGRRLAALLHQVAARGTVESGRSPAGVGKLGRFSAGL
jgi:hypothetical protein